MPDDTGQPVGHPQASLIFETFAVVVGTPEAEWRRRYRGWRALEKLEYVRELIAEAAKKDKIEITDAGRHHVRYSNPPSGKYAPPR